MNIIIKPSIQGIHYKMETEEKRKLGLDKSVGIMLYAITIFASTFPSPLSWLSQIQRLVKELAKPTQVAHRAFCPSHKKTK